MFIHVSVSLQHRHQQIVNFLCTYTELICWLRLVSSSKLGKGAHKRSHDAQRSKVNPFNEPDLSLQNVLTFLLQLARQDMFKRLNRWFKQNHNEPYRFGVKMAAGTPSPLWQTRQNDAASCSLTHPAVRGNHYNLVPNIQSHVIIFTIPLSVLHFGKVNPKSQPMTTQPNNRYQQLPHECVHCGIPTIT